MDRSPLFSALEIDVIRVVALGGAAVYLFALAFVLMVQWYFGSADFLASHGEPFLVFGIGIITGLEAINQARRLPDKI